MSRSGIRGLVLAFFLLCSPAPDHARPADAPPPQRPAARMRRSVTHAQLMHDKGRTLQDFKRRMWLQELLDEVHTAQIRRADEDAPPRPKNPAGSKDSAEEPEGAAGQPRESNETFRDGKQRRKKGRAGKRKDGDKRKRRTRSPPPPAHPWDGSGRRPAI
ncbi:parathyroid hormone-like hormone a [Stigmatopora argus]